MEHQVLARKWRPRNFEQMVGQEHVLKALVNALDQNRLHHAYLFTGTRGVGKTSIARILAKCLNCEQGVSALPCDRCATCIEINEGRSVDLIEVDAASRTKVDDTRELLENVQYAPTRSRYKVYLIDEVHMLSSHSFNALLKTLEEPPPHVKFLLATTDPQKLPVTVLSRCLQFNLKNMPSEQIVAHLEQVLAAEAISYEVAALRPLARAANGSMRDALSLTDQAIGYGQGKILAAEVAAMLGSIDRQRVYGLLDALCQQDASALLQQVAELAQYAPDFEQVVNELIAILHRVAVVQAVPQALELEPEQAERIADYAQRLAPADLQLYYQIALIGRRDLPLNPDPRAGLEMLLLRMLAFMPAALSGEPEAPKKKADRSERQAESTLATKSLAAANQSTASARVTTAEIARPKPSVQTENLSGGVSPARAALAALRTDTATHKTPVPNPGPRLIVDNQAPAPTAEAETQTTVEPEPAMASPAPKPASTLTGLTDNHVWVRLVIGLDHLKGMSKNILTQCIFVGQAQERIELLIDPQYIDLANASHQARINQALSQHFGTQVCISLRAATEADPRGETPAAWQQRMRGEELAAAREALEHDPCVQALMREFDASFEEDSIRPLPP